MENKTKPTDVPVDAFLSTIEPADRRNDARWVCALMARLSGEEPIMWGGAIVGFGAHHYRYASSR